MSPVRHLRRITAEQEPFLSVRSLATTYSNGFVIDVHTHPWHQLLYACTGAMTLQTAGSSWMIPPGKAVFIPARCSHSIRMWGKVAMRSLYFPATLQAPALDFADCRVISVSSLLHELILRAVELAGLDSRVPADDRLTALLLDEIDTAPVTPLVLPLPVDARALAVARHILADPAGGETLECLSRRYGVGQPDARASVPRDDRHELRIVAAEGPAAGVDSAAGTGEIRH